MGFLPARVRLAAKIASGRRVVYDVVWVEPGVTVLFSLLVTASLELGPVVRVHG
jgi:hypothetical protein